MNRLKLLITFVCYTALSNLGADNSAIDSAKNNALDTRFRIGRTISYLQQKYPMRLKQEVLPIVLLVGIATILRQPTIK